MNLRRTIIDLGAVLLKRRYSDKQHKKMKSEEKEDKKINGRQKQHY